MKNIGKEIVKLAYLSAMAIIMILIWCNFCYSIWNTFFDCSIAAILGDIIWSGLVVVMIGNYEDWAVLVCERIEKFYSNDDSDE